MVAREYIRRADGAICNPYPFKKMTMRTCRGALFCSSYSACHGLFSARFEESGRGVQKLPPFPNFGKDGAGGNSRTSAPVGGRVFTRLLSRRLFYVDFHTHPRVNTALKI